MLALPCSCMWQVYFLGVERLLPPALPWIGFLFYVVNKHKHKHKHTHTHTNTHTNTNTKTHKHTNTHSSSIFLAIYFVLFFCKILSPVLRWGRVITRHVEGLLHPCNCHFTESQQIVNCWLSIVWACCTGGYCTHTDSLQPKNILRFFASWPSKYI